MDAPSILIVGTGIAGYTVARELRRIDRQIPISLYTLDDGHFYSKPMLSNAISAGKDAARLHSQTVEHMREQLNVHVHAGARIEAINPDAHEISLAGHARRYSKLVLAVGANPIRIPLGGNASDSPISINNLADYGDLYTRLRQPRHIVILGAGLIGCEFANDLVRAGHAVTLFDPAPWVLNRLIPADIGMKMGAALEEAGVTLHCNVSCKAINHHKGGFRLQLSNGHAMHADIVMSAVGLRPSIGLARQAALETDRGIKVNRYLETSASDVYALGDCAQVSGLFLPYVMPTMQCARALAATLTGTPTAVSYAAMPVVVKTPSFPIAIAPPIVQDGEWKTETTSNRDIKALYVNAAGQATGFIVGGRLLGEYRKLATTIPAWLEPMG
jgi:rubredoxin-NAD+ reductase